MRTAPVAWTRCITPHTYILQLKAPLWTFQIVCVLAVVMEEEEEDEEEEEGEGHAYTSKSPEEEETAVYHKIFFSLICV
jgi:hypothetical protein